MFACSAVPGIRLRGSGVRKQQVDAMILAPNHHRDHRLFVTPILSCRAENSLDDFKKRIDVSLPKQGANLQLSFTAE